eukprot:g23574.t1
MKPRESARITTRMVSGGRRCEQLGNKAISTLVPRRILYFLTFAIYAGGLGFYTSAANNLKDLPPMGEQARHRLSRSLSERLEGPYGSC